MHSFAEGAPQGAPSRHVKIMMKHWTIWMAVWLVIASAAYLASTKSATKKSTRGISATADAAPPDQISIAPAKPGRFSGKFSKTPQHAMGFDTSFPQTAPSLNPDQKDTLTATAFAMAQTNPAAAVEFAAKHQLDSGAGDVLPNLVQQWAQSDFSSALEWATTQPLGDQRDRIFSRVAFVESQTAPRDAANLVIQEITPGPAQQEAALMVLHQWMLQDFSAAKAWADQFPEGDFKQRVKAELEGGAEYMLVSQPASAPMPAD